jgi:hypothetical protein
MVGGAAKYLGYGAAAPLAGLASGVKSFATGQGGGFAGGFGDYANKANDGITQAVTGGGNFVGSAGDAANATGSALASGANSFMNGVNGGAQPTATPVAAPAGPMGPPAPAAPTVMGPPAPGSASAAGNGPNAAQAAPPQVPFTPASIAAPPVAQTVSGPTTAQLQAFQKNHASQFDPNSRMDRGKMQQLVAGQKWASWVTTGAL